MKKITSIITCITCILFATAVCHASEDVIDGSEPLTEEIYDVVEREDIVNEEPYENIDAGFIDVDTNTNGEPSGEATEDKDAVDDKNFLKDESDDGKMAYSAIAASTATNIALGRPTTCSKEQPSEGHLASHINDGNCSTRWSAQGYPNNVVIDLGQEYALGYTLLFPSTDGGRTYQYKISVSDNLSSGYKVIVDRTDNSVCAPEIYDDMEGASGRYVKFEITNSTAEWVSIYEFEIYPFDAEVNWAGTGTVVEFSAQQNEPGNENLADNLIDNNVNTRWSAQYYPNYVIIDFGEPRVITRTEVVPLSSRAYKYEILASLNGKDYYQIVDRRNNAASLSVVSNEIAPIRVRYVKFVVTGYSGGEWISINELKLFGTRAKYISPVTDVTFSLSGKTVTANATSASFFGGKVMMVVVVFDGDKMIDMKTNDIYFDGIGYDMSGSVMLTGDVSGKTIEAFIWDTDETMMSCSETFVL